MASRTVVYHNYSEYIQSTISVWFLGYRGPWACICFFRVMWCDVCRPSDVWVPNNVAVLCSYWLAAGARYHDNVGEDSHTRRAERRLWLVVGWRRKRVWPCTDPDVLEGDRSSPTKLQQSGPHLGASVPPPSCIVSSPCSNMFHNCCHTDRRPSGTHQLLQYRRQLGAVLYQRPRTVQHRWSHRRSRIYWSVIEQCDLVFLYSCCQGCSHSLFIMCDVNV